MKMIVLAPLVLAASTSLVSANAGSSTQAVEVADTPTPSNSEYPIGPVAPYRLQEPGLSYPVLHPVSIGIGGVSGAVRAASTSTAVGAAYLGDIAAGLAKGIAKSAAAALAPGALKTQIPGKQSEPKPEPPQAPMHSKPLRRIAPGDPGIGAGGGGGFGPIGGGGSIGLNGPSDSINWSDNAPSQHLYNGGGGGGIRTPDPFRDQRFQS